MLILLKLQKRLNFWAVRGMVSVLSGVWCPENGARFKIPTSLVFFVCRQFLRELT